MATIAWNRITKSPIKGTLETLSGCALFSEVKRKSDGSISYEYVGETEVFWDEQRTVTGDEGVIYLDEKGNEVTAKDIGFWCDGDCEKQPCLDCTPAPCPTCGGPLDQTTVGGVPFPSVLYCAACDREVQITDREEGGDTHLSNGNPERRWTVAELFEAAK